ncbi:hypothetical protein Asppvi_009510 [Aspergillus pseudoviridinutans]|uniref:Uncharacterized protein n=1 Tax=Aspergillus pseudoviridinutans TaxID=1517512 RepID=A0A9P3BKD1_9EURO|nr:uncharacterized protein Asppvi_009510 [Aspergillus pseudoviridinutans]GIJ90553.1 hypothetical protein Asppvi_009510 [Aspergillus pseudoviridinutans]
MTKDLTFDVHFDNELAHEYYGDGEELTKKLREIYHDRNLKFPDVFDSTLTTPPVHFLSYPISVEAPDDVKIEELQKVEVPPGLHVDIIDFQME